jgi:hypothetical protein
MAYVYDHVAATPRRDGAPCLAAWGAVGAPVMVGGRGGGDRLALVFRTRRDVFISFRCGKASRAALQAAGVVSRGWELPHASQDYSSARGAINGRLLVATIITWRASRNGLAPSAGRGKKGHASAPQLSSPALPSLPTLP